MCALVGRGGLYRRYDEYKAIKWIYGGLAALCGFFENRYFFFQCTDSAVSFGQDVKIFSPPLADGQGIFADFTKFLLIAGIISIDSFAIIGSKNAFFRAAILAF